VLDQQKFNEIKDLMGDGFGDFVKLFLSELRKDIDTIMDTEDVSVIKLKAHSQKSSCGLIGVSELSGVFLEIEELANQSKRSQTLIDKLPELFLQLEREL